MAKIVSLGGGTAADSVGWTAEQLDADAESIVVAAIHSDGTIETRAFGPITLNQLIVVGAYVQRIGMDFMVEADEE